MDHGSSEKLVQNDEGAMLRFYCRDKRRALEMNAGLIKELIGMDRVSFEDDGTLHTILHVLDVHTPHASIIPK